MTEKEYKPLRVAFEKFPLPWQSKALRKSFTRWRGHPKYPELLTWGTPHDTDVLVRFVPSLRTNTGSMKYGYTTTTYKATPPVLIVINEECKKEGVLRWTLDHELGHALGFGHLTVAQSIMVSHVNPLRQTIITGSDRRLARRFRADGVIGYAGDDYELGRYYN